MEEPNKDEVEVSVGWSQGLCFLSCRFSTLGAVPAGTKRDVSGLESDLFMWFSVQGDLLDLQDLPERAKLLRGPNCAVWSKRFTLMPASGLFTSGRGEQLVCVDADPGFITLSSAEQLVCVDACWDWPCGAIGLC